jgi:hypothetical protein
MGWPFREMLHRVSFLWPSPTLHRHPRSHAVTTNGEYDGRLLTITVHDAPSHLLEVFVQSSDRPFSMLELYVFLRVLVASLNIPAELWTIRQADWNIDAPGTIKADLSILGLSIAGFGRLIAKVYQKSQDLVRTEIRTFEELPSEALLAYLKSILEAQAEAMRGEVRQR